MKEWLLRFTEGPTNPHTIPLFRTTIYAWVLIQTLVLLPAAEHFWSPVAYIPPYDSSPSFERLLCLLSDERFAPYYRWFIGGQLVFLVLGLARVFPLFSSIMIYFFSVNLSRKAWVTTNGGHNLIDLMLLYLVVMALGESLPRRLGAVVTNVGFFAARLQLVVLYAVAGLSKIQGSLWRSGVALYYVLNTEEFTTPFASKYLASSDLFVMVGTYSTLVFMLSFPFLVWVRKARPYVLGFGVLLHLSIAFVMGLTDFGFAMLASYVVFFPDELSKRLLSFPWPLLRSFTGSRPSSGALQ